MGTNEVVVENNNARHIIVATPNKVIYVLIQEVELVIVLVITYTPPKVKPHHRVEKYVTNTKDCGRQPNVGPPYVEDPTFH